MHHLLAKKVLSVFLNRAQMQHLSTMEQISLSSSWLSAGLKLSKLMVLKNLLEEEKNIVRKLAKIGYSKDGTELGELKQGAVLTETDAMQVGIPTLHWP